MPIEFQQAEQKLQELIDWYNNNVNEHSRNEATTRLHLIDRLLFECLGWDKEDCVAEERISGQYKDYSFRCPSCLFILEAKKEGIYFELPSGNQNLVFDISFFLKHAKDVGKAIEQAVNYCQKNGTPYGAVCNGHQLIAFIASRNDGYPPLEGKALVFDSLQSIKENFLLAWQCLSKQGIIYSRLSIELSDTIHSLIPEKISPRISDYPGFQRRNTLQTDLQILSELFIEDIARLGEQENERDFLKECYCRSGALSQYAAISKEILQVRYSSLFQQITEGPSLSPATSKKGLNSELLAQALSKRPILLIGDVGVGKTMFIKHLYQVEATDVFDNTLVLYIDFGSHPTLEKDIEHFIYTAIKNQLIEKYALDIYARNFVRAVLHRDIERFKNGLYGDIKDTAPETYRKKEIEFIQELVDNVDDYLKLCLNHIQRGRKKQIVVFLDNVDQRHYEFQERVFLLGQSMAEHWPITVFISIRPETFYRSRLSGTLKAYHQRAFTISPPRVDEVVVKRLKYGIGLLKTGIQLQFSKNVLVKAQSLSDYLNALVYSFENMKELNEFLDNMCGGNIRLALDFVRAFIGSGHVDTEKILNIYKQQGFYNIPLHEFLRAVIYGDHKYYSPSTSEILNLFDITTFDGKEHFLASILLAQLELLSQKSSLEGYIDVGDLYSYLQGIGFTPSQIDWCINRLLYRNLIESPIRSHEHTPSSSKVYYRLTSIGAYYLKNLIQQFTYIDAMVLDTPLVDPETSSKIPDVDRISDRLARAITFCDYLDSQWVALEAYQLPFSWPTVRNIIDNDISYITGRLSDS